jgi:hypothetical protein
MPVVIQGFVKNRKRQWGHQGSNVSLIHTAVAATRVLPWRGVPTINPNWTFEDVDDGTLIGVQAPSQRRWDITSPPAGPLAYDDIPDLLNPSLHGGVTPTGGGAAKTWTYEPDYEVPANTPLGMVTEQYGDDVLTDWAQLIGGVFETVEISGEVGAGPVQISSTMRFAKANGTGYTDHPVSGTVPTTPLTLDDTPAWVYADDLELFLDNAAAGIGGTKIENALHTFNLRITNEFDLKSFANGSNTRFQIQGYGRGPVSIELVAQYAKTSQTVGLLSEADKWLLNAPTKRFAEMRFTSPEIITGTTPYSWVNRLAGFYSVRDDGEIGNNTTLTLTLQAKLDATLGYGIWSRVVNARATL